MEELLHDTHFWVLLAFIIFAVVAFKKGKAPLLSMLDSRTERIRRELDEAERLKSEAQDLLAECQRKHRDALQTSQKIVDNAKETAAAIEKESEKRLTEMLQRKEEQLNARIARMQDNAVAELRAKAVESAVIAAEALLQDVAANHGQDLVKHAIEETPRKFG